MTISTEGDLPSYVIETREGVRKITFGSLGDVLDIEETAENPQPISELRRQYEECIKRIHRLIEDEVNPEYMREALTIQRKIIEGLERRAAPKSTSVSRRRAAPKSTSVSRQPSIELDMSELERNLAIVAPAVPASAAEADNLAHLQEEPLNLKKRILSSTDCVQRIIKEKKETDIRIDDQAMAINYSECDESKTPSLKGRLAKLKFKIMNGRTSD